MERKPLHKYHIYSFRITNSNAYSDLRKIGYTGKANPRSRVWEWERDTNFKFTLVNSWVFYCENRFEIEKIERAIHRKFTNVKELPTVFGREWFQHGTDYDIDRVVTRYQEKNRQQNLTRQSPTHIDNRIRSMKAAEQTRESIGHIPEMLVAEQRKGDTRPQSDFRPAYKNKKNRTNLVIFLTLTGFLLAAYALQKPVSMELNFQKKGTPVVDKIRTPSTKELTDDRNKTTSIDASQEQPVTIPQDSALIQQPNEGTPVSPILSRKEKRRIEREKRKIERQKARLEAKEARKAKAND